MRFRYTFYPFYLYSEVRIYVFEKNAIKKLLFNGFWYRIE